MDNERDGGEAASALPTLSRFTRPIGVLRAAPNARRSGLGVLRPFAGTLRLGLGPGRHPGPRLALVSHRLRADPTSLGVDSRTRNAESIRPTESPAESASNPTPAETESLEPRRFGEVLRGHDSGGVDGLEGSAADGRVPAVTPVLTRTRLVGQSVERGRPGPSSEGRTDAERGTRQVEGGRRTQWGGERQSPPDDSAGRTQTPSAPRTDRPTRIAVTARGWPPTSTNGPNRPARPELGGTSPSESGVTPANPPHESASERQRPTAAGLGQNGREGHSRRLLADRSVPEIRLRDDVAAPNPDGSEDTRLDGPSPANSFDRRSEDDLTAPTLVVRRPSTADGRRRPDTGGNPGDDLELASRASGVPISTEDGRGGDAVSPSPPSRVPTATSERTAGPSLADLPREDVDQFVDRVYRELEHRQRVERQRLGL